MKFSFCVVFFRVLLLLAHYSISNKISIDELNIDLGEKEGLSSTSVISGETLKRILAGVENGNSDNIYYYGLIKLYGISVTKDLTAATSNFLRASSLGHMEATTAYGVSLLTGLGVQQDYTAAVQYFRRAVAMGDLNSHWLLGKMLTEGKGVPGPSFLEAALLLQKASEDGNVPQAQHLLAIMYEYSLGVEQNFDMAARLYRQAAEQQHVESMYHLALMYAYGRGAEQDFQRARPLLESASNADHAPSIYYIGLFKTHGYGCEVNYDQAANWFERAAALQDPRVSAKAYAAMAELRALVDSAQQRNNEVLDRYQRLAENSASVS